MYDCTIAGGKTFWFAKLDKGVGRALRDTGEFAALETELLVRLHQSKSTEAFVDVGANVGSISVPFAGRLPQTPVFAYDAHPQLHGLLMCNIVVNGLQNIVGRHCAIGDFDGVADFPTPNLNENRNFGATGFNTTDSMTSPVLMRKLDTLLSDQRVGTIKIDVEGFEGRVFAGAEQVILRDRPAVLFEANIGYANSDNARWFLQRDYHLYWFYAPTFGAGNEKQASVNPSLPGDMNILAMPNDKPPPFKLPRLVDPDIQPPVSFKDHPYLLPLRRL